MMEMSWKPIKQGRGRLAHEIFAGLMSKCGPADSSTWPLLRGLNVTGHLIELVRVSGASRILLYGDSLGLKAIGPKITLQISLILFSISGGCVVRMLLTVKIPHEHFNKAVKDGSVGQKLRGGH